MEVDKKVVLNMVYTFLEDNGYLVSLEVLQKESECSFILPMIKAGKWESVLAALAKIHVADNLLYDLYEQIVFELVEEGDGKIGT